MAVSKNAVANDTTVVVEKYTMIDRLGSKKLLASGVFLLVGD